ncbi:hypothetical protein HanPSC8_Chr04g0184911 [Helianthus annuus]|nr:hypothetical protein HanIR_Chr04g0206351 [Helianthus annuus]KAJ0933448.1 hypothetical protein HanPSC8_Chr04g0184911 [Helianthus annuus]
MGFRFHANATNFYRNTNPNLFSSLLGLIGRQTSRRGGGAVTQASQE